VRHATEGTRREPTGAAVLRPELTESIHRAVLEQLAESGYGKLSMDAVARRAGVGKSALYRRWPAKQDMVVDVVSALSVPLAKAPDTGSLRGDLRAVLEAVHGWLTHPLVGRIMPDLIAEAGRSPALAAAIAEHLGEPRRAQFLPVLDRAAARGELAENVDRDVILDLGAAPIHWRLLVRNVPVDAAYLDALTDTLVRALT
jgi:AcrR family transcriptional regulator